MEIHPSIIILLLLFPLKFHRHQRKREEVMLLRGTPQRLPGGCENDDIMQQNGDSHPKRGVFTAKAIVVYLLMDRRSYFTSVDSDNSGHIRVYLISQPPTQPYITALVVIISTQWRRAACLTGFLQDFAKHTRQILTKCGKRMSKRSYLHLRASLDKTQILNLDLKCAKGCF